MINIKRAVERVMRDGEMTEAQAVELILEERTGENEHIKAYEIVVHEHYNLIITHGKYHINFPNQKVGWYVSGDIAEPYDTLEYDVPYIPDAADVEIELNRKEEEDAKKEREKLIENKYEEIVKCMKDPFPLNVSSYVKMQFVFMAIGERSDINEKMVKKFNDILKFHSLDETSASVMKRMIKGAENYINNSTKS